MRENLDASETFNSFDPSIYTRAPLINRASGIALAQTLLEAMPKGAPAHVKKAAERLRRAAEDAQAAWAQRQRGTNQPSEEDTRAVDQEADSSWSGLRLRLQGYASLPPQRYPAAKRALELLYILFGTDGLSFLKEQYPIQWANMDTLLKRIEADGLDKEIDQLCGKEFLQQIRDVHPRYAKMVQSMLRREDASGPDLRENLRAISRAVVDYASKVVALVDGDDPESIAMVRAALRPIEQHRELAASRRSVAEPSGDPPGGAPAPATP